MENKLLTELLKAQDNLQDMSFEVNGISFTYYFRYMTLLEKSRIEQMAVKTITTINDDGSKEIKYEKQPNMIPVHTIIEKALDKEGKRLYSHTNPEHIKEVSMLPYDIASQLAYLMTVDVFNTISPKKDD